MASGQALAKDEMQDLESFFGCRLIVLIVRDESTTEIGRKDFSRLEVLTREGGLPAAGRSDEQDQRELGEGYLHRVKTPICVGAPTSSSHVPTGLNITA